MTPDLSSFLNARRQERKDFALPRHVRADARRFLFLVLGILYPHFTSEVHCEIGEIEHEVEAATRILDTVLTGDWPEAVRDLFWKELPAIRTALDEDAAAINESDPASSNADLVILAYPGFFAVAVHRIAHFFYEHDSVLFSRLLSEIAHRETGIEIHPGAKIGQRFAIDHGSGIVIGETSVIGNRVRFYQGVALVARVVRKDMAGAKRHPTIEDDVVIYANATIIGGATTVGAGSTIGGNVWLTESVPPGSRVTRSTIVRSVTDDLEFHI